jgi:hypothetical protein
MQLYAQKFIRSALSVLEEDWNRNQNRCVEILFDIECHFSTSGWSETTRPKSNKSRMTARGLHYLVLSPALS